MFVCELLVIRHQAGKAELKLTIVGPRGNSIPFTMNATALGDHVVYTPRERGPHLIYVSYGGLDVPGTRCYSTGSRRPRRSPQQKICKTTRICRLP